MATYSELQAQIAKLQHEAELALRTEKENALKQIRKLMSDHGITVADLQSSTGKRPKEVSKVQAKYRDPATGATWTGRGRAPLWLNGRSKDNFLIS